MSFIQKDVKKIVFFGDSITQAGVNEQGYITRINRYLQSEGKADQYALVGKGIGGNKVYDLYLRHEEDVLALKPDVVVMYVGINDVWHKTTHGTGTDADKYQRFYTALIKKFKAAGIQVALCTPSVIGEKLRDENPQDKDLNAYADIVRKLAQEHDCPLIDLRKSFMDYETRYNTANEEKGILTTDRVHLNDKGNQLVADAMIEVLKL